MVVALAITTWLHYATSPLLFDRHTVYRYLYFLPIVYAALRFGLWGGLAAGITASLLFAPHIWLKFGQFPEESLNDFFVAIILIAVGVLTGALTDGERRQRQKQEAASAQQVRAAYGRYVPDISAQAVAGGRLGSTAHSISATPASVAVSQVVSPTPMPSTCPP